MIKRILLAIVSLAIILAFYFLYAVLFAPPVLDKPAKTDEQMKIPVRLSTTAPATSADIRDPEDAVLAGEGDKPYFERYAHGHLLYQFWSDHWKPAGTGPGRFALIKPEMRLFLRGGQILQVSAAEGEIEVSQTKGTRAEPKRGELRGKVHIFIDRGTDPNRPAPELRPDDILHIWMDSVKFDLVRNVIESDSAVKMESEEAFMTGQSLSICWNEVTNLIEDITIKRGDKLVLRQGFDMMNPDMPFTKGSRKDQSAGTDDSMGDIKGLPSNSAGKKMLLSRHAVAQSEFVRIRKPAGPTTQPATASAPVRRRSGQASTQPKSSKSYDLVFTSAVKIQQYDGTTMTGKMNCDRLHILFDVSSGAENKAFGSRKPATTQKTRQKPKDDRRLEIFWEGPLQVRPANMPYSPVQRFHIVATGQPIQIDQTGQGTVQCKKLTYFQEAKQLWLDGTTEDPVRVSQEPDRTIVAAHLFYDRKLGIASGTGAGFMQQRSGGDKSGAEKSGLISMAGFQSAGQKMTVLWKEGFSLNFGEFEKKDAAGVTTKQYLKRAEFRGAARVQRSSEVMAGDLVKLTFLRPGLDATSSDTQISMLHAERNVLLQADQQRITCDLLDVEFGDRSVPRLAKASGHVSARERKRVISADSLTAALEERQVAPTTNKTTTSLAIAEAGSQKPKTKTRIVLKEIDANGNVAIDDPDQPMTIRSDKMHAILALDGALKWCYLEGTPGKWATASMKDNALAGEKITMDLTTEQVDIPGPGELQFVNREDIEGSRLTKPTKIAIAWADSMKLSGGKTNQGTFLGKASARSDRTTVFCERMVVDFENKDQPDAPAPSADKNMFWIFPRLVGQKTTETTSTVQLPVTRKRPRYIQAFPAPGKQISIIYLEHEDNRVVSRRTLWGDELSLDFGTQKLTIPGAGTLFVEEYRLPTKSLKAAKAEDNLTGMSDPFTADLDSSGPSQTRFSWRTGLTYLLEAQTAIFDGTVTMLHAAGGKILAEQTGKKELADKVPTRMSTLTCENLKVEFMRGALGLGDQPDKSTTAGLRSVLATGAVNLQDKPRSILAHRLMYNQVDKTIAIYGNDKDPAYLYEENDETGQSTVYSGPWIMWDREKNEIHAPDVSIISTLR